MRRGIHLFVDVHDPAIKADEKRPPRRKWLIFVYDAIGQRHGLSRITQQRIVDTEGLCKRFVCLWRVDANRKVRNVETADVLATLTE